MPGLAFAAMVTFGSKFLFLLTYTSCKNEISDAVQLPNAATFEDWGSYINLALPAVLMKCSDDSAFRLLVFIAGYAGVDDQAAFVVLTTITSFIFMVPLGLSISACSLIGNAIGKQDVPLAKRWFKLISAYNLVYCLVLTVTLIVFKVQVASLFTK